MVHIPERIDSKYRFVLLASKRAEQIVEGAPPEDDYAAEKPTRQGMYEVADDRVQWDYGPGEESEEAAEAAEGEASAGAPEVAES